METKRSEIVISRFLVFFSYCLHILYQSIKEELMDQFNVYKDMKARTNGEIYIGVVGPVRTGKSTFIKRFMNLMVLPNIEDENDRNRANDELPQSSSGNKDGRRNRIKCPTDRLCGIYGGRRYRTHGRRRREACKNTLV